MNGILAEIRLWENYALMLHFVIFMMQIYGYKSKQFVQQFAVCLRWTKTVQYLLILVKT